MTKIIIFSSFPVVIKVTIHQNINTSYMDLCRGWISSFINRYIEICFDFPWIEVYSCERKGDEKTKVINSIWSRNFIHPMIPFRKFSHFPPICLVFYHISSPCDVRCHPIFLISEHREKKRFPISMRNCKTMKLN